ncbi:hypothetical protein ACEQ8H_004317 [Pleosporales sp. CAS-2024a]
MYTKSLLFALAVPALISGAAIPEELPDPGTSDIIGGNPANRGEVPFAVSIQLIGKTHRCAGTILDSHTVLSSAYCFINFDPSDFQIRAGTRFPGPRNSGGGVTVSVRAIIRHPKFDLSSGAPDYDVAILKLFTPGLIGTRTNNIAFAKLPPSGSDPRARDQLTMAGWGAVEANSKVMSPVLRTLTETVIGRAACNSIYANVDTVTDREFCLSSKNNVGFALGDTGNPTFDKNNVVVGMPTWTGGSFGDAKWPNVYVRLGHPEIMSFINANLG